MNSHKVEVLLATMDYDAQDKLLQLMNVQTDIVIGDQSQRYSVVDSVWQGSRVKVISTKTLGIGRNRNTALRYAENDLCVLADDDIRFYDDYAQTVIKVFADHPKADVIVFNIGQGGRYRRFNKVPTTVHSINYMNYGACRLAFRRKSIVYHAICFSESMGGKADIRLGEDTLFLRDCLRKGLKILAVPEMIAELVDKRVSTWNEGHTPKMFFDRGVLAALAHRRLGLIIVILMLIKHYSFEELFKIGFKNAIRGYKYISDRRYLE